LFTTLNPVLNLTFSLLPITSSHPHASVSDSIFDYMNEYVTWDENRRVPATLLQHKTYPRACMQRSEPPWYEPHYLSLSKTTWMSYATLGSYITHAT